MQRPATMTGRVALLERQVHALAGMVSALQAALNGTAPRPVDLHAA